MNSLIEWFAGNRVVANLLMFSILGLGLSTVTTVNQEVFPEFEVDIISIAIPYLGAAPEEVEAAVVVRVEEAIEGLEGVKRITATAAEGSASITVEVETGYDTRELLDDVKARVDGISTFPLETEEPVIQEVVARLQVINVSLSGNTDELTLKRLGQEVRDEIANLEGITQADLRSVRPYEIAIEVSEADLRRYGLTFDDVAQAVRRSSMDLPGGSVKAESGEILLRTIGQAYRGGEYEDLTLMTRADGSRLRLADVARVIDGFEETDAWSRFDGAPTVMIQVFRIGDENAPDVSATVHEYVDGKQDRLPPGISIATWQDTSVLLSDRTNLLLKNGFQGLVLVFIILTLFLRMRLALWVAVGIPIAFLGAIAVMPHVDLTINMMTLFSFILVLGIVVDDAIVVAERVHAKQDELGDGLKGAIVGTQEVAVPVIFGVLTTMVAFAPFMFVPGMMGNFTRAIPLIVIPVLFFSVVESKTCVAEPSLVSEGKNRRRQPKRGGACLGWFLRRFCQWTFLVHPQGLPAAPLVRPRLEILDACHGTFHVDVDGRPHLRGHCTDGFFPDDGCRQRRNEAHKCLRKHPPVLPPRQSSPSNRQFSNWPPTWKKSSGGRSTSISCQASASSRRQTRVPVLRGSYLPERFSERSIWN